MTDNALFEKDIRRVLIIKHGAFGDIIQSQGAVADVRRNFPNAKIHVLTEPGFKKIWDRCPHIDGVILDPRKHGLRVDITWSIRRKVHAFDPQLVIDLQNSPRTDNYRKLMYPNALCSSNRDPKTGELYLKKPLPILERLSGQLRAFGLTVRTTEAPQIDWMANDVSDILDAADVRRPYVVLIPGSSARHPQKRWPYFKALASHLIEAGFEVVTAPGPDEIALCQALPGKTLLGEGFLNWFDLAGVLSAASFVVGNDTGPTHIAAHLDKQGVALFGPHTSASFTSIHSRRLQIIERDDLAAISVDEVAARVKQALRPDQLNSV